MLDLPVDLEFTPEFEALYGALPPRDVARVDEMLDRLEVHHARPEMRGILRVGAHTLFHTPRIYAPSAVYRVTWVYHPTEEGVAVCVTVAEVESR